jgi:Protein of unknown function (DUF2844)
MRRCRSLVLVMAMLPAAALAALGASLQSVEADRAALKASVSVRADARYTAHEIQTPAGTRIREFVSTSGVVFAVSWTGRFMPDLRQMLGAYFEPYQNEVLARRKGRSPVSVITPTLVVHSGGRQRAFSGLAYLPLSLPAGVTISELR